MSRKLNSKSSKAFKSTDETSTSEQLTSELTSSSAGTEDANASPDTIQAAIIRSMREEFSTMREDFNVKFDGLLGAIGGVKNDIKTLTGRITETEERIGTCEDEVECLKTHHSSIKTAMEELTRRVDDQENRSRRSNLRLVGLPEFKEQGDMCAYLEKWIPSVLGQDSFPQPLIIERAHRVGRFDRGNTQGTESSTNRPRAVVMKFLNYADKVRVMRGARQKGDISVDDKKVMFFPDLSADLLKRRKVFDPVKKELAALTIPGLRFGIIHPATLLVTVGGRRHTFDTTGGAESFIQRLKMEKNETTTDE